MKTHKIILSIVLAVAFLLPQAATAYKNSGGKIQKQAPQVLEKAQINDVYVVLFIVDGAPKNFFYKMIDDGMLPSIKKYLVDDGVKARTGISTFPSASAPAYQGFITGLFAGRSGIPYLQWYDREAQKSIDYLGSGVLRVNSDLWNMWSVLDPKVEGSKYPVSIFERLGGYPTAAIYSEISRGAKERHPGIPLGALADTFITHHIEKLDSRALKDLMGLFNREEAYIPRLSLVGLYTGDVIQHEDGEAGEDARLSLIQFDKALGEFVELLKTRGIFDKTYMIVAADHGMHKITRDVDVRPVLKKAGLKEKMTELKREDADVFISERGVSSAHLYFRGDGNGAEEMVGADKAFIKGLDGRPSMGRLRKYPVGNEYVDVIELLRQDTDLSLIAARNGYSKVEVFSKDCHGTIRTVSVGGHVYYGYKVAGCDPLNYCDNPEVRPLCGGSFHDDRAWLSVTWDKHYPDAVVQLGQIFDDGRAGDMFIVAADDAGFYKSKMATHGSIISEDMQVPVLIRGPGLKPGEAPPLRIVDIHSAMLSWFGLPRERNQDGNCEPAIAACPATEKNDMNAAVANLENFMFDRVSLIKDVSPEEASEGFKKVLRGFSNVPRTEIKGAVDKELALRSSKMKKLKGLLSGLSRKDDLYPLVSTQLEKTIHDISRLNDVETLLGE